MVCFGSGTIRAEYAKTYGSPFAVEIGPFKLRDSDLACEVTRSLFDTIRQYRESFDVYGTKLAFEWEQVAGERPVLYSGFEDAKRVEVPDYGHRLPKEIAPYTIHGVYDEQHEHTSFIQGAGHGGSHPHLAHEFIRAIVEGRESARRRPAGGQLDDGRHLRARIGDERRKARRASATQVVFFREDQDGQNSDHRSGQHRVLQNPAQRHVPHPGSGRVHLRVDGPDPVQAGGNEEICG